VVEARIAGRTGTGVLGPENPMPGQSDGTSDHGSEDERGGDESPEWSHQHPGGYRQPDEADAERQGIDPAWSHKSSDREDAALPVAAAAINVEDSVTVQNHRARQRCAE